MKCTVTALSAFSLRSWSAFQNQQIW